MNTVPASISSAVRKSSSLNALQLLKRYECHNITYIESDGSWPIVWKKARGVHVWDAEGRRYLDLTAAFGVAAAGHANPRVVAAGRRQMATLLHAMGDVHPHALKGQLAQELSRLTFERWGRPPRSGIHGKTIFCNSGFEAVEAALKTSLMATGKRGIIAFQGAYHGLGYGTLNATSREHFRGPFETQLGKFGHFVQFPLRPEELANLAETLERLFRRKAIGAVLVEPVQGRGGIRVPPVEFLPLLRKLCDRHGSLLIADEIYTGFGRTGRWFGCEHAEVAPDLICLGKALAGGFPISACVGSAELMDAAWPKSTGEAIHTSTFLGHPVGCAMALAQIGEIRQKRLVERSAARGRLLTRSLSRMSTPKGLKTVVRGLGLMAGLELCLADGKPATGVALKTIKEMLRRGFVLLPEGEHSNVISFTPPLTIAEDQIRRAVMVLNLVLLTPGV